MLGYFFEELNNKDLYPISNFRINEILKNDKNFIGTFCKDNVPILKNNESTIVNLADSFNKGTHSITMKFIDNKLFYFDSYGIPFIPDIIKKQYKKIIIQKSFKKAAYSAQPGKGALIDQ